MNVAFKDWPPGLSTNSSVYMCRQPIQKRIRFYYYNFSNNQTNFIRVKLISVMVRVRSGTGLRKVREFFRGLFKSSYVLGGPQREYSVDPCP